MVLPAEAEVTEGKRGEKGGVHGATNTNNPSKFERRRGIDFFPFPIRNCDANINQRSCVVLRRATESNTRLFHFFLFRLLLLRCWSIKQSAQFQSKRTVRNTCTYARRQLYAQQDIHIGTGRRYLLYSSLIRSFDVKLKWSILLGLVIYAPYRSLAVPAAIPAL